MYFYFAGETLSTNPDPSLNDVDIDRQGQAGLSYAGVNANSYYDNYYYNTDQGKSSSLYSGLIRNINQLKLLRIIREKFIIVLATSLSYL